MGVTLQYTTTRVEVIDNQRRRESFLKAIYCIQVVVYRGGGGLEPGRWCGFFKLQESMEAAFAFLFREKVVLGRLGLRYYGHIRYY